MRDIVENKRLFAYLESRPSKEFDFSLVKKEDRDYLDRNLRDIALALYSRERKKLGVENNGLCLLLGYLMVLVETSTTGVEAREFESG